MKHFVNKFAPMFLTGAVVILSAGIARAQALPTSYGIAGQGSTGEGGWDLTVSALITPAGVSGQAALVGGVTGPVVQVVPPSAPGDCWCINVQRTDTEPAAGNQKANIYIRDIGDGIQSFDQMSFVSGIGIDCSFPKDGLFFLTLAEGDFQAFSDSDNDGVSDDLDQCPDTAAGSVVNEDGCSIVQLVPCAGPWKNHGAYVAAMSSTAQAFVATGGITQEEAIAIVDAAAKSDCGKKKQGR